MNERRSHWPCDLTALRYLDALDAGDLETVAALWEEASHDLELERMLAELDGTLFVEEVGGNGKGATERAQRLQRNHVPDGSPALRPSAAGRRWASWFAVAGALAAASVLVMVAWLRNGERGKRDQEPSKGEAVAKEASSLAPRPSPLAPSSFDSIAALLKAQRNFDEPERPTFTWPLPEPSPIAVNSIPADLFD